MENQGVEPQEEMWQQWEKEHKRGKVLGGIAIVIIGSLFLARELGVIFPAWLLSWKMGLIALGVFSGIKHGFRNASWFILVAVGGVYLAADFYPELAIKPLIWPLIVIFIGLMIIFKPHRKNHKHHHKHHNWERWSKRHQYKHEYYNAKYQNAETQTSSDECIDCVSFMSGIKKNILSKNFKSGDVTIIFAGAKIDLSQADFEGTATLEITEIFGGTQLIIPANWDIKSDIVCVFGSVEDKRPPHQSAPGEENKKLLILRGTVLFGGIEIKSF
ncbi:MAG: hypothetical protein JWP12_237 [Bacteroidetes bacterium]|nr:hypothetical protein [Bacteroidota bacterium]